MTRRPPKKKEKELPLYWTVRKASQILGWHWNTTYNWAKENCLIEDFGNRELISLHKFKVAFPDVYLEIVMEEEN